MCDIPIRHASCLLIHTLLFEPTQPPVLISPANQTAHYHFSKIIPLTVLTHVRYATHDGSMHCPRICHHTHVMTVVRCQCTRCDIIHSPSHVRTIAIAFSMLAYLHDTHTYMTRLSVSHHGSVHAICGTVYNSYQIWISQRNSRNPLHQPGPPRQI